MKKTLTTLKPATVARARMDRKIYKDFAEKLDFVYFGRTYQHDDEYQVIHGFTLSNTARDNHFSVGTYHGYDMSFLERRDVIKQPRFPSESKRWIVMTADLHAKTEMPHMFIGRNGLSATFYRHLQTKYPHLQKVHLGHNVSFDPAFNERFSIYTKQTHALFVEHAIHQQLQYMIVENFPTFLFEVKAGTLYVYVEITRPSNQLLARLVQCSAWLASELDKR